MDFFTAVIENALLPKLPTIQRCYDDWNPTRPGMGLCGIIARCIENTLKSHGFKCERWSESDHCYVVAMSDDDGIAVAIDIPWHLYETPNGDPTKSFCSWMKVDGHTFTAADFTFTTIS
jgi:hypothetical protein